MQRIKQFLHNRQQVRVQQREQGSKRAVLDELFNDMYNDRHRIYKINFVRGILFGAGSALGGTIVIALIVWTLSLFVNAPLIGELFKNAQQSIQQTTDKATR